MKITDLEVLTVPDGVGVMMLVVLDTDEGLSGIGEVGMRSRQLAVAGALEHFRGLLVGQDPSRIEHLWQVLSRAGFFPANGFVGSAVAAVDMALWDLRGKALGVPLYELFGGRSRDHVECYVHLERTGRDLPALLDEARARVAEGWRHLRLSVPAQGFLFEPRAAVRQAVHRFQALREALGDEVELLVDVHTRLDPAEAVTLCRELEPARPFFVEDPLRCENLDSYRMLRLRTGVPLAAGEQLTTKWEFRPLIEGDLIDHARVDVANTGLTEARKIAAMAEAHHIRLATHNPLGPLTAAASLHLNLALPNVGVQEHAGAPAAEVFLAYPRPDRGRMVASDLPGLGVEIDRATARGFTVAPGELPRLHRPDGSFTNW